MDNDFPRMLYRCPGAESIHGGSFATLIAADADEQTAALADGWHLTTPEASEAHAQAEAAKLQAAEAAAALTDDTRPPTREELELMAEKLGIPAGPKVSDKKLRELIDKATKAEG